jgi:transcriptional regulator with XRE-family HTH domain
MSQIARIYPLPVPRTTAPEPLWREVLGRRLRRLRLHRRETLLETAEKAGISPQYLSEIERGRKEPSSEMIAAVAGALGTNLLDLTEQVTAELRHSILTAVPDPAPDPRTAQTSGPARQSSPVSLSLAA